MKRPGFVYRVLFVTAVFFLITGCGGNNSLLTNKEFMSISDIKESKLSALSQKSFYFGHQSVGLNIVDGLRLVMVDYPDLKLNVEMSEDPAVVKPGSFLHSKIGENRKPQTKIKAFENVMDNGMGDQVDAAFLKFCYVDAYKSINAEEIFKGYKNSIETLKAKYPKTTFIHFTMPLKSLPTGWKVKVKNVIGKEIPVQIDNAVRGDYNEMLRKEYNGKEPVFDIAGLESIALSSGERYRFKQNGKLYEALAPENTSDGGHLSDKGKRWIAEQLIVFLAYLEYKE